MCEQLGKKIICSQNWKIPKINLIGSIFVSFYSLLPMAWKRRDKVKKVIRFSLLSHRFGFCSSQLCMRKKKFFYVSLNNLFGKNFFTLLCAVFMKQIKLDISHYSQNHHNNNHGWYRCMTHKYFRQTFFIIMWL